MNKAGTMKKPPLWATVLTILGVAVLCALGVWQLQRLHWKTALLDEIDAAYQMDATQNHLDWDQLQMLAGKDLLVLRGTVIGQFLNDKSFFVGPRPYHEKQGRHLYTPLQMKDGKIILVNRGWMPLDLTEMPPAPGGIIKSTGLFRKPDAGNVFTPKNNPAKGEWYLVRIPEIAAVKGLNNIADYVLYAEPAGAQAENTYPLPIAERLAPNNNHLSYAIFWFTMASLMIVIYILRFLRPPQ